jgi:mannose-6-phosphate isomerase-like protein (cupin superfamily)
VASEPATQGSYDKERALMSAQLWERLWRSNGIRFVVYVLEGTLEYHLDGQPPTTVNAGEVLLVPAETVHAVRNIGRRPRTPGDLGGGQRPGS